ncbi:MAG: DoxX family protein [Gammaproteobacteria bacterium]|nr:DoxX family protein [Gammaproteobacteria bacterium]
MLALFTRGHAVLINLLRPADGLPLLLLRLYLAPVMWLAGTQKLAHFDSTVEWFGNSDWGLGMPLPWLMAGLATWTEILGAVLLALGLATRYVSVPLLVTMVVAALTVHWPHGWAAIASSETAAISERLARVRAILQEHGNYEWLTSEGSLVILNNGIEFAATYALMLLVLIAYGGGRYLSIDHYLARYVKAPQTVG